MGCCYDNKQILYFDYSNPSELYIRDILSKLKMRNINKYNFQILIENPTFKNVNFNKKNFDEIYRENIIDENERENPYLKIHSKIFFYLIDDISDFSDKNQILLQFYPLLKKKHDRERTRDYSNLLEKKFGKQVRWDDLSRILGYYFKMYCYKMNNIIIHNTINEDLINHTIEMTHQFFNYDVIVLALENLHEDFDYYLTYDDGDTAEISNLNAFFLENGLLDFETIRDYLINTEIKRREMKK